jgi:SAM-dependent methyltransferase
VHPTLERWIRRVLPGPAHYLRYRRSVARLGDRTRDRAEEYRRFVASGDGRDCLQIGVRDGKCAPHWISVDLYDTGPEIDFNYDIHDLPFADESFDRVVCNAVLEHVPRPWVALAEFLRVLRPQGEIWVEIPFGMAYHEDPQDYWRVTPDGMRIWLEGFEEVSCGLFLVDRCAIHNGVYFHGRKPGS